MEIQWLLIKGGRDQVGLEMDGKVQEIDIRGQRREDPLERAEGRLAVFEVQPALTIYLWIGVVNPNAELIIDVTA